MNIVLLENNASKLDFFTERWNKSFPFVNIMEVAHSIEAIKNILRQTPIDLTIIDLDVFSIDHIKSTLSSHKTEVIYISESKDKALEVLQSRAAEYLLKPIRNELFIGAMERVGERIALKNSAKKENNSTMRLWLQSGRQSIGIPTIEGFSFFKVSEIIRCEGLQKCTRIITTTQSDIISSYNIGEFRKLLEPYGFFTTHRSHLINMAYVRQYRREGSIVLKDNSKIPVSKRRKSAFLDQILHP